ncbi:conserved exported hypothetical protein [Nostocoides japonicum T1-X7]|uniref:GH26 domain-containing protein n=1 Tax=Nostocoides japonicum T1-X7 TaxID=1194083 RepID=A0A077M035_9MICO|nr:glycosyl hydrolase family 26 [Tetrasphaera japonica]CCH79196.1 conserved exported hypothetical protein [Tetrasphaera japonica T1-X7]
MTTQNSNTCKKTHVLKWVNHTVLASMVAATMLLAAGCSGPPNTSIRNSHDPVESPASIAHTHCTLSTKLVPSCGVLWGVTTPRPNSNELATAEAQAGRPFAFVYRFHDINDTIPTDDERSIVAQGKILHISIDSRDYASADRTSISWSEVASGKYDSSLLEQARGIASLGVPVFVTFDHEPDQPAKVALGTGSDFVAAWRHVHDLFQQAGATNAVWVWVIMGWQPAMTRAATLWPGNDYVDWLSWEAYNQSGCQGGPIRISQYESFEDAIRVGYDWFHTVGPKIGIDANKPMMISEAGSVLYWDDPAKTAQWYQNIPGVLEKYPQIKAIGLWDHTGTGQTCDFRLAINPDVLSAAKTAGQQPLVNPSIQVPRITP